MRIHCDGLANPNPGKATWAFTDIDTGDAKYGFIGDGTNNEAEYRAVLEAVKYAWQFPHEQIYIFTDSMLVVNQVNRKWKCKKSPLLKLRDQVLGILPPNVSIGWVKGTENQADHWTRVAFREATGYEPKLWKKRPESVSTCDVCPTCHRPFESKESHDDLTEQFNFATAGI
jgi:ribonuclease HI